MHFALKKSFGLWKNSSIEEEDKELGTKSKSHLKLQLFSHG